MLKLVKPALAAPFNWASALGGFPFKGLSCRNQCIVYWLEDVLFSCNTAFSEANRILFSLRYSPGSDNYALACSIVMGRSPHTRSSPNSQPFSSDIGSSSTHWRQKSNPDGWVMTNNQIDACQLVSWTCSWISSKHTSSSHVTVLNRHALVHKNRSKPSKHPVYPASVRFGLESDLVLLFLLLSASSYFFFFLF